VVLLVGDADKERRVVGTVLFTLHVLGMAFMMVISAGPLGLILASAPAPVSGGVG
jgi:hypothetical protein